VIKAFPSCPFVTFVFRVYYAWAVLIALVLLAGLLSFYKVDQIYPQIAEDLKKRRSNE
jgi:hypothetical protein